MTREEAILLSAYTGFLLAPDFSQVHKFCEDTLGRPIWTHEFADRDVQNEIREKLRPKIMELIQHPTALRGPTREMVERMRGEWQSIHGLSEYYCSRCGEEFEIHSYDKEKYQFCPHCMAPMTDEAVEMVMRRLEALKYGEDCSI